MPRMPRPCLALALLALPSAPAMAAPIRYEYGGVIETADPSTGVVPGTRFSGTFAYDPAQNPNGGGIPGMLGYHFGESNQPGSVADGSGLTLRVGGQALLAEPGVGMVVSGSEFPGQFGYVDANGSPKGPESGVVVTNGLEGEVPLEARLTLANSSRWVLDSFKPPLSLSLEDFPRAQLEVTGSQAAGSPTLYSGTIDTLTAAPVPEPATWAAWCLVGLGALAARRRARGA